MKNTMKTILSALALSGFLLAVSCDKEEGIDTSVKCRVAFVTKVNTPALVGDTIFMDVVPGQLVPQIPVVEKPGFYLEGWYTDAAQANTAKGGVLKFPAYDLTTKPIYLDVILYARWLAL